MGPCTAGVGRHSLMPKPCCSCAVQPSQRDDADSKSLPAAGVCALCPKAGSAAPVAPQVGVEVAPRPAWPLCPSSEARRLMRRTPGCGPLGEGPVRGRPAGHTQTPRRPRAAPGRAGIGAPPPRALPTGGMTAPRRRRSRGAGGEGQRGVCEGRVPRGGSCVPVPGGELCHGEPVCRRGRARRVRRGEPGEGRRAMGAGAGRRTVRVCV